MRVKSNFFVPSLADFFALSILLGFSFLAGNRLLADGDTGYHIRAGEIILESLAVPKYDIFSFISPPLPWTAHEWLSEVIMALVHRVFGLTGVVIFFAALIALIYHLLFKILRVHTDNILAVAVIVLLVATASKPHWLARPHIFSLLLMLIWYYVLDLYQYNSRNYIYYLPPLMVLWVNLHGGFMGGFILLGVYLLGNGAQILFSSGSDRCESRKKFECLSFITFLCLIAALTNPYGYHILLFPFKLASSRFIMDNIDEFRSPNFHQFLPFTYLLLLMIAVTALSRKALNIIETTLVLLFTYMALYSVRYIPLFGIIVAPIVLRQIDLLLKSERGRIMRFLEKKADNIAQVDASARDFLWPIIALSVVVMLAAEGRLQYDFDKGKKPVDAVKFLKKEHLSGNMFNDDEFGDYIIYSTYPGYKVFFDGRSDMYGSARLKEYSDVTDLEPGWEKILEKYEIKWIIFGSDSRLSTLLLSRNDWRLIYSDKVANIFVKSVPENQYLIDKYRGVEPVLAKN